MARVSKEEIDRLKRDVSIVRLVEASGIELKPHGKNLVGHCMWHDDRTPSLVVTPDTNLFHCMGKCSFGGSVIDWVMKVHGVGLRHAIEILRSDQMPIVPARHVKKATTPKLPSPVDFSADDWALLRQVVTFYHHTLKKSPEALAYLNKRGVASPALIDRFQIGFANRTLGLRLPERSRRAGAEIRARLQKIGILAESGHERLNGSVVIPVIDEQSRVLELYGRKIRDDLRAGTPDHLYLPGPRESRGVFNIEAVARYPEIILCESLIDALTFLAAFPNVTTSYGTNGFTDEHLEAFRRFKTKRVLIAYDRDDAGDEGAAKLAPKLMAAGIECFRVQFPRGMDANDYALKVQPAAKGLGLVIRSAVWMGKGPAPRRETIEPVIEIEAEPVPALPPQRPLLETVSTTRAAVVDPTTPVNPARDEAPTVLATPLLIERIALEELVPLEATPAPAIPRTVPPRGRPTPAAAIAAAPPASPDPVQPLPAAPPAEPPPASPVPPPPPSALPFERRGADIRFRFSERIYRVRGLERNADVRQLVVNVMVVQGDLFHQDKFDMSLAPKRTAFTRQAAIELGVGEDAIKKELGRVLLALEELQDEEREAAHAPKKTEVQIPPEEREEALAFLADPRLLDRILEDFSACAVVGEETNKLVGILAAVSRFFANPLAVVIESSSAAGKSSLMDAILKFIPREHNTKYSAMTGQSLFYMGEADLAHKVLAIVEEEGAERASYALKLLQSEGELTIASTGKDPATGRHVSQEYHVEGPVMIFLTTTSVELDEELLNRCIVLTVNEDREQTRLIHQMQREQETIEGQLKRDETSKIIKIHQNAQRLLRPLKVGNPFARQLTFRDDLTRTRRDHRKYLTLIRSVALLHQYQRPVRTAQRNGQVQEYIEVTADDIKIANRLANEVLGRTLDELHPQTRRLLARLHAWVTSECERLQIPRCEFRFQRRDVRALGWSDTRGRAHLDKLVEFEYVVVHRGARGQTFVYELLYNGEGQDGQPFLMGLFDVDRLPAAAAGHGYDLNLAGSGPDFAAPEGEFAGSSPTHRLPIAPRSPRAGPPRERSSDPGSNGNGSENTGNADPWTPTPAIASYTRKNGPESR